MTLRIEVRSDGSLVVSTVTADPEDVRASVVLKESEDDFGLDVVVRDSKRLRGES